MAQILPNDILYVILSFCDIDVIQNYTLNKYCLTLLSNQFFINKFNDDCLPIVNHQKTIHDWCNEYRKVLNCQTNAIKILEQYDDIDKEIEMKIPMGYYMGKLIVQPIDYDRKGLDHKLSQHGYEKLYIIKNVSNINYNILDYYIKDINNNTIGSYIMVSNDNTLLFKIFYKCPILNIKINIINPFRALSSHEDCN